MDNPNKEIFYEIIAHPITSLPLGLGGTMMIYSIMDGSPLTFFAGVVFTLISVGTALNGYIYNQETIVANIIQKRNANTKQTKEESLKTLTNNLTKTPKTDDDNILKDLKTIYFNFLDDVALKELTVSQDLVNQITVMFDACVKSLNYTFVLYQQKDKVSTQLSKQIQVKRNELLEETNNNVQILFDLINQIRMSSLSKNDNTKEIESIKKNVTRSLKLAQDLDNLCRGEVDNTYEEYVKNDKI